jgi:hypothetical protein
VAGLVDYSKAANRTLVAATVFASNEYLTDLLSLPGGSNNPFHGELPLGFYQTYLDRNADSASLASEVALMKNGAPDSAIVALILGSDEYLVRSGKLPG